MSDKRLRFRHEMRDIESGAVAAVSEIMAVHLDKQEHKSCPLPETIRQRAAALAAGKP